MSIDVTRDELSCYEIGEVRKTNSKDKGLLKLYYRPNKEIFTVSVKDKQSKLKENEPIWWEDKFIWENIAGITTSNSKHDTDDSIFKLWILAYQENDKKFEKIEYCFTKDHEEAYREFKVAESRLSCFNLKERDECKRSLWVLVNPISGKKLSWSYYQNILKPVLEFNDIHHEIFETDSSTYIEKFIENLKISEAKYTDFITIGGDGVFGQLVNAIVKHPDRDTLLEIPIGLMPGGSTNSLCCDLNCKDPFLAAIRIARGNTVKGDMFKVELKDSGKILYSTAMTYGFPCDLIIESENLRNVFGRYRYIAWGIKRVWLSTKSILYDTDIYYKCDDDKLQSESVRCKPELKRLKSKSESTDSINVPKSMKFQSLASKSLLPDKEGWIKLPFDNKFLFVAVVTHEIRSSINKEVFAPFARLGEGTMHVAGVKSVSRINALRYVNRASQNTHLTYERFFHQKATELKFKWPPGSRLCVDGEPFKSSDFSVKLLPGFINLIGEKNHVNIE